MKDKTHRQRIEDELMYANNPEFRKAFCVSFALSVISGAFIVVAIASLAAGVSNIIR